MTNPDVPEVVTGGGSLVPTGNGEWHDVPVGEQHTTVDCRCDPQLQVSRDASDRLRSLWVHRTHAHK